MKVALFGRVCIRQLESQIPVHNSSKLYTGALFSGRLAVLSRSVVLAIIAGYVPAAIAYGALARAFGMPVLFIFLFSLIVYSGALQSAALGLWAVSADPILVLVVGFLVNLRLTIYGPHIEHSGVSWDNKNRVKLSGLLTDEIYAVGVSELNMAPERLFRVALLSYASWFVGTVSGVYLANYLPTRLLIPLTFALPALFLGLLLPRVKDAATVLAVIIAIALSIVGKILMFPPEFAIVPIIIGGLAGYIWFSRFGGDSKSITSG